MNNKLTGNLIKYRNIIPVWKKTGQSTHRIAKKISKILCLKAAHTGTLDPIAEGVVVVLVGRERFNKDKYSNWKKSYIANIIAGISTDTHDVLGLVENLKQVNSLPEMDVEKSLNSFKGNILQYPPNFSAIRVSGKRLFKHARENTIKNINVPLYPRIIYKINLKFIKKLPKNILIQKILDTINKVSGDFRQKEIINKWKSTFPFLQKDLYILQIHLVVSRGTYIRSIIRDLSYRLNLPMTIIKLTRIKNGLFEKKDCIIIRVK